ncbi:hypothetical protein CJD36_012870 [Flavipsychrobacter stenotrophus]|uniref:Secretion system C-terminal sorting domain-containing protein n=2 Tax=Flavipsychrobacter stenotrophus TaxID=2077091 RepID=A0A2S7SW69_9BACT|nr:hypothetical protein CJD36_012870 [Flavipsychrobacter stenotrophus]
MSRSSYQVEQNSSIMKKLFTSLILSALAFASNGQTVTATLTTPPCHADGVLTSSTTGLTPPLTFTYYLSGSPSIVHSGVATTTDALTSYAGQGVYIVVSGGSTTSASTYYAGAPPFTYTTTTTNAVCPALGTATATVTGGTAPYTYTWTNQTTGVVTPGNPAGLSGGAYDLMVTDAAGCMYGSIYANDSIAIYTSPGFTYSVTTTAANCTNGTATVASISGGLPPYSYVWSTMASTSGISGLSMGSYNVTVTDANGCSDIRYAYVSQAITITSSVTPTPATCTASNGAVIAFGAGGTPPYTYLWSNGATTQSQGGLGAGYYSVVATDANGCIGNGAGSVVASTPITATYATTASSCTAPTGTATLTLAGGTTPYAINWYTYPAQTGLTATALAPGNYSFHVTDAVGCLRTGTVTINPIDIINLSFATTSATCTLSNGSATVTSTGGVAPLTYAWVSGGTTATLSAAPAGYHYVTVTDVNGCSKTGYAYVASSSPVNVAMANTSPSCLFTSDGSVHATVWGGTTPYSYNWSTGASTSTITSLDEGYYSVYVTDATGCTAHNYTYLLPGTTSTSCYCTISGTVYHDLNGNCTQDAGEPGIQGIQIHCSGWGYTYTNAAGHYSFIVPSGSYTISETVQTLYPLTACAVNNVPLTIVASTGCTNVVNFANDLATIHDIHISTWDYNHAIPGNTYTQATIITNEGTVNEGSILAGYKTDGQIFAPTFIPGGIFSGAANWYSSSTIPSLTPGASQAFHENYTVPTDIPLSTDLVFRDSAVSAAPMTSWLTDYTPWNNVNYFTTTVVGSYDPNFKEVSPKGTGPTGIIGYADSVLEYMVHFQNTGTYYAEKVVVIDTLDPNLDWATLHPVYQSHQCVVTMNENGVATFTFNGIHLPYDPSYPVTSNGMFTYTIKTRHGLPVGTQIRNRASIYFDYNTPIITNSTLNTIGHAVGIPTTTDQHSSFSIYPNPAEKTCFAVINSDVFGNADMQITDITGKVLISKTVSLSLGAQTIPVDINTLAPGMYLVSLHNQGKVETQKLVIMK